ncbi:hypothetical protein [Aliarcobacter butzleri]|uniref:hypothetical protein n=1 Tax=Aliarcobacter butzleri TaxID=28197 RepID=UPI0021B3FC36|nr:hypothetical protein [Aliarcobacter butzleri]MCT7647635.1 hypothetical protein [Aliarcobacter butzleri]
MINIFNPFSFISKEENEQIMNSIIEQMEEFKNSNEPFSTTNINLRRKWLCLWKKKYGKRNFSISAFRKFLLNNLKKTKKIKNKSARF